MEEILEKIEVLGKAWDLLLLKKNKLKGTTYYCSQELKKARKRLKESLNEGSLLKGKCKELEKEVLQLQDKLNLNEDKLAYYKKQEIELSYARSIKTMNSEELNPRLIQQNQEILERFHREEERSDELEEENQRLREQNEKNTKKIFKLKMEINKITQQREMGTGFDMENNKLKDRNAELKEDKERLEEENDFLRGEKEKIQIVCDTYEEKMNELIDRHNEDVEGYEDQIQEFKREMRQEQKNREMQSSNIQKLITSNFNGGNFELKKIKDSLIKNKQLETEMMNLKSENSELKIELLSIKQKYMNLMNKYSLLKKKVKLKGK